MNNLLKNKKKYLKDIKHTEEILKEIDYQLENLNFKKNQEELNNKDLFIVTYRSKPIKGIILELQTINPKIKKGEY